MATHLLRQRPPAHVIGSVALKGLPQQRIEGFACADGGGGIGGGGESRHVRHLFDGIAAASGLVQAQGVLEVFRQTLQHGQRFAEVHLEPHELRLFRDALTKMRTQNLVLNGDTVNSNWAAEHRR